MAIRVIIKGKKVEVGTPYEWPKECICKKTRMPMPKPNMSFEEYFLVMEFCRQLKEEVEVLMATVNTIEEMKKLLKSKTATRAVFEGPPLKEYIKQYLLRYGEASKFTKRSYKSILYSVLTMMPEKGIRMITVADIDKLDQKMIEKGFQRYSRQQYHARLRAVLQHASACDDIEKNPYDLYKMPSGKKKITERHTITSEELQVFWDEFYKADGLRKEAIRAFLLQIYTGMRVSDALKCTHEDIKRGYYFAQKTGQKIMFVAMGKVTELTQGQSLPISSLKCRYEAVYKVVREIGDRLGVKIATHDARRTFASVLAESTGNISIVQKALGHTRADMTLRYVTVAQDSLTKAMNDIDYFK